MCKKKSERGRGYMYQNEHSSTAYCYLVIKRINKTIYNSYDTQKMVWKDTLIFYFGERRRGIGLGS